MADYYSVLKKAVAGLQENTGSARRAVYQRARTAIVKQLKNYDPPLTPTQITDEQLKLEEAIRKVEAESARESLGLGSAPEEGTGAATKAATASQSPEVTSSQKAPAQPAPSAPASEPAANNTLKDAIRDAGTLGGAAHDARQKAQQQLPETQSERKEPIADMQAVSAKAPLASEKTAKAPAKDDWVPGETRRAKLKTDGDGGAKIDAPAMGAAPAPASAPVSGPMDEGLKPSRMPMMITSLVVLIFLGLGGYALYSQKDDFAALFDSFIASEEQQPAETQQPAEKEPEPSKKNSDRLLNEDGAQVAPDAKSVQVTRIGSGESKPTVSEPRPVEPAEGVVRNVTPSSAINAEAPPVEETVSVQTNSIRPAESIPAKPEGAAVAQQSILYEESATPGSSGTATQGRVVWRLNKGDSTGDIVQAEVSLPDRNMKINLSLEPNTDNGMPASHLVKIRFELPATFSGRGIANVAGLIMKTSEQARGDALLGASVQVTDEEAWIALSDVEGDRTINMERLKDREWIDIPLLYSDGKRAILTLEKGVQGNKVLASAMETWN
ncbi:hypothetical protein E1162_05090 [Rhodobacteraceae bacterium RKSG542]|uniref:hypothetical protein n=1 Tax=Pseudovibrio flavus TaxID=2529854 RepID=UPI0012BB7BC8|nr:hypothetical protein [Pseudovibrio flavus]MTI16613.1 hypothetical protein [Pseudovibrio flavus]